MGLWLRRRITNRESARRMRVKRQVEQDNLKAQVRNRERHEIRVDEY